MIEFRDVKAKDRELIQSFTLCGERQNCDLSIANIISWRFLYNTQFAVVNDFLVFRFYAGHHLAYMMPIPRPTLKADGTMGVDRNEECSARVIRAVREDSIAMGHPFLMMGVCNYMGEIIEQEFPGEFDIKPDRNYADYIYTREKLSTLAGKKLQSKRNHVNKFKNLYPNYEYRPLTKELIPECLKLEQEWRIISKDDTELDEGLSEEYRSMTRAFRRWDDLGLIGGTIWVEGKLVAFTFGCPINYNTFDVCVEKADVNYEGSFTIINQEFVKHLPEQYKYINREEDMGEEGLRRAKLSYKPDILLEKNIVMEKHPLADFEDQDRIKEETKELWRNTFADPEPFIDLYFSKVYKNDYNITCQINRHVEGALQTLPYPMWFHGREVKACYISGVSVKAECRKQHIGANLMRQAHFYMYYKDIVLAALIPAEEWLFKWYEQCGYASIIACTPPPQGAETMDFATYDTWQRSRPCILLHSADALAVAQEDIRMAGSQYKPATKNVPGMLRVVNARKALELHAMRHPDVVYSLRVNDDSDIPMNNAYYRINKGQVRQTAEPDMNAEVMSINRLAEFIFKDETPEMNLMLN